MRFLKLLPIMGSLGWAHSVIDIYTQEEEANQHAGIYSIAEYRGKDLYPHGVEGSVGYELHGEPKQVQVTHIGGYLYGQTEGDILYGVELNHHKDSPNTINYILEKAFVGYDMGDFEISVGRSYNNLSFLNEKAWGYGFGSMPLAIDSFIDGTYIGDGIFLEYTHGAWVAYADLTEDRYNRVRRGTLKAEYRMHDFRVIAYAQSRAKTLTRINYAQNTHTHGGTDTCQDLLSSERCFQRESKLYGVGFDGELSGIKLQGEYLYLNTAGTIENNAYQVQSDNQIESLYLQALKTFDGWILGARSEWFVLHNTYEGAAVNEIVEPLISNDANTVQNLQSLLVGYQMEESHRLTFEFKHSQNGWATQLNYFFVYGN